jgi:hypothetical protein
LGKSVFKQIYGNFINGIQQWRLLRGGRWGPSSSVNFKWISFI